MKKTPFFLPQANEPCQTQAQKGAVIGLGGIVEKLNLQQGIVEIVSRFLKYIKKPPQHPRRQDT